MVLSANDDDNKLEEMGGSGWSDSIIVMCINIKGRANYCFKILLE